MEDKNRPGKIKYKIGEQIFLHWSYQDFISDPKNPKRNKGAYCAYRNIIYIGEDLDNIEDILCTNRKSKMVDEFNQSHNIGFLGANTRNDPFKLKLLPIIKHILRRPFYPINIAGGHKIHTRNNNKTKTSKYITKSGIKYSIYVGPRGGHYIKVNNKYKLVHNK